MNEWYVKSLRLLTEQECFIFLNKDISFKEILKDTQIQQLKDTYKIYITIIIYITNIKFNNFFLNFYNINTKIFYDQKKKSNNLKSGKSLLFSEKFIFWHLQMFPSRSLQFMIQKQCISFEKELGKRIGRNGICNKQNRKSGWNCWNSWLLNGGNLPVKRDAARKLWFYREDWRDVCYANRERKRWFSFSFLLSFSFPLFPSLLPLRKKIWKGGEHERDRK